MARRARGSGAAARCRLAALLATTALLLLLSVAPAPATAQSNEALAQSAALRQIGDALGPTRGGFSADAAANDPCDPAAFPGVACDANGVVTSITLAGKRLEGGSLPDSPATWQALPGLRTLDASSTGLGGALPGAGLAAAPNLANVDLSGNDFSGGADGLAAAPSLETLNLSGNARLCGEVPASIAGKADVTGTGAGVACGKGGVEAADGPAAAAAAAEAPPAEAAAPAANATAPAPPAAPAGTPSFCVCASAGQGSQSCKDEVYNNCDAAKTTTPSAACNDLQSGDAKRIGAALAGNCGGAAVTASSSAAPSSSPRPAGAVAEVAPRSAAPPPPPVEISNAPVCAACAVSGFASPDCGRALAGLCAAPGAPADVCGALPADAKDREAAKRSAQQLGGYLGRECFKGSGGGAGGGEALCACFSAGVSTSDCAQARVQLCARGDALCLPAQALSGVPAGVSAGADADALAAEAAQYGSGSCPVAAPERPGVQAALTFQGVGVSQFASSYSQGVANALAQAGGVSSSAVQRVDLRPAAAAASSGRRRRRRSAARRFLLQQQQQQPSPGAVQATYFVQSADPDAVAQRLQQSAGDGALVTALGNNGVPLAPSLSLKSYLPSGSLGGGGEGAAAPARGSGVGFPMWGLAPIIVGGLLLLGTIFAVLICCRQRRARKARAAALPAGGKLVVGGVAAAGAGAAGAAAARAADDNHKPPVPPVSTAAPTAYSTDPYADPYAPAPAVDAKRSGSASLNAALGGGTAPAPPPSAGGAATAAGVGVGVGVGAAAATAAAAASARRGSSGGGADLQSHGVPLSPAARVPSTSAAAPSASEWKTAGGGGGPSGGGGGSGGGAAAAAAAGPSRSVGGGAAGAVGAGAALAAGASASAGGRSSAQQAERAKFWAQFQESWQQVRQDKASKEGAGAAGGGGGAGGAGGGDEPGTPSSGTQWTDQ